MKKILVTGGCGYIGSHTIVSLLEKGFEVVSVDSMERGMKYVPERVEQITGKKISHHQASPIQKYPSCIMKAASVGYVPATATATSYFVDCSCWKML